MDQHNVIKEFKIIKKRQFYAITPMVFVVMLLIILLDNPEFTLFGISRTVLYAIAFGGIPLRSIRSPKFGGGGC